MPRIPQAQFASPQGARVEGHIRVPPGESIAQGLAEGFQKFAEEEVKRTSALKRNELILGAEAEVARISDEHRQNWNRDSHVQDFEKAKGAALSRLGDAAASLDRDDFDAVDLTLQKLHLRSSVEERRWQTDQLSKVGEEELKTFLDAKGRTAIAGATERERIEAEAEMATALRDATSGPGQYLAPARGLEIARVAQKSLSIGRLQHQAGTDPEGILRKLTDPAEHADLLPEERRAIVNFAESVISSRKRLEAEQEQLLKVRRDTVARGLIIEMTKGTDVTSELERRRESLDSVRHRRLHALNADVQAAKIRGGKSDPGTLHDLVLRGDNVEIEELGQHLRDGRLSYADFQKLAGSILTPRVTLSEEQRRNRDLGESALKSGLTVTSEFKFDAADKLAESQAKAFAVQKYRAEFERNPNQDPVELADKVRKLYRPFLVSDEPGKTQIILGAKTAPELLATIDRLKATGAITRLEADWMYAEGAKRFRGVVIRP